MINDLVVDLDSKGYTLQEAMVFPSRTPEYWHSSPLDPNGFPISGGFDEKRNEARKIAIAELLERQTFRRLLNGTQEERKAWGLNIIPTACGFAAGFDKANTVLRSLNEAVERWVMSKWIDDCYAIEEVDQSEIEVILDPVSRYLLRQFDSVRFFRKEIVLSAGTSFVKIEVGQTMGFVNNGVYPGSSAQYMGGNLWQHALLESFRHLLGVRNNPKNDSFPHNKINFFATNSAVAEKQIANAKLTEWPAPKIRLHKLQSYMNGRYFVARTIIDGWRSWHEGPIERFLY